ncbi:E3 ubiquitin-protein ligase UPL1 [Hondaea fermentalgiana]|uniref:HECT-type E3 ubiquitin transferase n=1 Tax=Hondaea fermentalgiana TaxID=2315210 RepID=A0A2R5GS43_9STRA|nr:E3 ubiquitin-protein ligase UPL1 [Hondaea fermentalgiana]|eukprot:GBG33706.1 E3 ubiquitin-protein ligase UPL1 [Hondaea fermentalgiana]
MDLAHDEERGEAEDVAPKDRREAILLKFVQGHGNVLNSLVSQSPALLEDSFSCLLKHPQCRTVLDFDNKRQYFTTQMRKLRRHVRTLNLVVRRSNVFEDSFMYLRLHTAQELRGRLSVKFDGEEGIDAGGPTREWFQILAREMFKPDYGLFKPSADSSAFQPDPRSSIAVDRHLDYFRFVGRIVGKAVADGHLLDAHFTRSFYKHILGLKVTPSDMQSLDPEYYRNLMELTQMNIEEIGLDLTFSADIDVFGSVRTKELFPGGAEIPVTEENKRDYIRLVTHYRMTNGIRAQLDAFLEGFHELVPAELISIFDENELELLIAGVPEIDLDDLKANTEYVGYSAASQQIRWFWKCLEGLPSEDHARFLMFVTGTSKVPLDGFKNLIGMRGVQRFTIHKAYGSDDALPQSHSCFNQLDLPAYNTEAALCEKLTYAIHECTEGYGFG